MSRNCRPESARRANALEEKLGELGVPLGDAEGGDELMDTLTLRPELDRLRCDEPRLRLRRPVVLGSLCHPEAPVLGDLHERRRADG